MASNNQLELMLSVNSRMNIDQMTIEEKLQTMEMLWNDLCDRAENQVSSGWHKGELANREAAIERGDDEFIGWEEAKRTKSKAL